MKKKIRRGDAILPAKGRLGVLIPGLGAVSTTLIAGVLAIRKGLHKPIGSVSQSGKLRLGLRTNNRIEAIKDLLPLADLDDIVFGAWDIFEDSAYEAALHAKVLDDKDIQAVADEMKHIKPMKAVFDRKYVKRLDGPHVKKAETKMALAQLLMQDIENFKQTHELDRIVICWAGSTEAYKPESDVHQTLAVFEQGLESNSEEITPSQIYAYAALSLNIPYINGAPHISTDCPALLELAEKNQVAVCGKDFKTGQTLLKTILAPGIQSRLLGISGWFSTNILGNRDGEVLDDVDSFKSKEVTKLSVLESILKPEIYPELYKDLYHKVRINYYPPRGDNKESWDNIDIFGWMNYPMQIKVNFLCRDSILAAPVMLDLILFTDLSQRAGMTGILEWLSFFFKSPMVGEGLYPENDLFAQRCKMENVMRYLINEEPIHHTGLDYYYDLD
ncbi:MAG: inositol-3-phosphate synthase [Pseudomonadota bacterium]